MSFDEQNLVIDTLNNEYEILLDNFLINSNKIINNISPLIQEISQYLNTSNEPESLIKNLLNHINLRDEYTLNHSTNVYRNAINFGIYLGLDEIDQFLLTKSALYHDIGKIAISDEILMKKSKLDWIEYENIKTHSTIGYLILNKISGFEEISKIVLHHHERWDGKGYPEGLIGEQIPFLSRIISIVDTYDAMTSQRTYNKKSSHKGALDRINEVKGCQLDPNLVEKFNTYAEFFPYNIDSIPGFYIPRI